MVFLKEFYEKVDFEKLSRRQKNMQNYPVGRVNPLPHRDAFLQVLQTEQTQIRQLL